MPQYALASAPGQPLPGTVAPPRPSFQGPEELRRGAINPATRLSGPGGEGQVAPTSWAGDHSPSLGYMGLPVRTEPPHVTRLTPAITSLSNSARVHAPKQPSLPKSISYNGKGSLHAFLDKFQLFADKHALPEEERRYNLILALDGEASKFLTMIRKAHAGISFNEMIAKLEKRFGRTDEPAVARLQFQSALQYPNEDLAEWGDRLLTLASRAFADLPDKFVQEQVVAQFCRGAQDRVTGHLVLNLDPGNLDIAMQKFNWYKYTERSMYAPGSRTRRDVRQLTVDRDPIGDRDPTLVVQQVTAPQKEDLDSRVKLLETENSILRSKIDSMMTAIMDLSRSSKSWFGGQSTSAPKYTSGRSETTPERPRYNSNSSGRTPDRSESSKQSPSNVRSKSYGGCYNCGEFGHFSKVCPVPRRTNNRASPAVAFEGERNGQGSEEMRTSWFDRRSPPPPSPFR